MAKENYPHFAVPKSYLIPEGVSEGETFEDIAQFKLKANGQVCIVKLGESPVLDEGNESKEPDDFGTSEGMNSRMDEAYRQR